MENRWIVVAIVAAVLWCATGGAVWAQQLYGSRLSSNDGQWLLPVATRLLGSDEGDHLGRGSINAWDLSASLGTPVYAAAPGRVSYVDCYGYEQKRSTYHQGYGCAVDVDHGNGIVSQVAHCAENTFFVRVGQQVDQWTPLCRVGVTGSTSWPHAHFDILRNGSAVRLDQIFDKSQMHHCKFCRADNDPNAAIQGATTAPQKTTGGPGGKPATRLQVVLGVVATLPPEMVGQMVMGLLAVLLLVLWLAPNWLRAGIAAGAMSLACGVTAMWLMTPIQAAPAAASRMPAGDWQAAYKVVIGSEGAKCTEDGAHTAGGITQGAYDAWRMSHGMGPADVCRHLTEQQRQQIFYERYWVASGANQLPAALALTYVDHYFNTGKGKAGLAQCGNDVRCFNNWRVSDYRSKANCSLYCAGWINRVNRIRKLTE